MKAFGSFRVDPVKRRLWRDDEVVPLTPKAFDTLLVLVSRAGQVVEKDEILKAVWPDTFVEEATLAQNVSTLRRALGDTSDTPTFIATVPRRGYRFVATVSEVSDPDGADQQPIQTSARSPGLRPGLVVSAVISGALLLGLIAGAIRSTREGVPERVLPLVFGIDAPGEDRFSASGGFMAVSPDGRYVAFVASDPRGVDRLWLRSVDSMAARILPGTEGAFQPFWSPDSRLIAFFAGGKLKKVPVVSGPVQTICETPLGSIPLAGTWNDRDDIIFSNARRGIVRVAAAGGVAAPLVSKDAADDAIAWPQFLPDGRHFLYLLDSARADRMGIYVGTLDSEERIRVAAVRSSAMYSTTGHLLFVKGSTLVAQPFDVRTLKVTGAPLPIAEQVMFNAGTARGTFSISRTGLLAYRTSAESELVWFDRAGRSLGRIGSRARYLRFAVSPDNMHIAAARLDPQTGVSHIWLIDAESGGERRLTFDGAWELQPIWSRDGSRVAFSSNRSGRWEIFEKAPSGDGAERLLLSASASVSPEDWSPDGRLLFQQSNLKSHGDFWLATPPSDRDAVALPYLESDEGNGRISPDGRWIAYRGYESGWFIYVRPLDSSGARWPISDLVSQWSEPRWRADGKELFYLSADLSLMSVDILGDRPFRAGPARLLFHTAAAPPSGASGQAFDIAPDGLRVLIKTPASPAPITVVFDWPALAESRR